MTIASVEDIGAVGVITDQQSNKLPFNAWSSVKNARFENNEAKRVGGYSQLEEIDGAVIWALPLQYGDYAYWITCSTEKIYAWDGNTNTDITRVTGDMTGGVDDQWNGGIFAGIAIMNNGIDIPQYWAPGTSNAADLIDWDSTWQAQIIRPYKNMLIAMDMTENGTRYPTKYRWSNIADPGSIPDWDETDPANQAGSDVIEETQGFIVDGEALRDSFILYKEDSFFQLQFIGGEFVIANRMILKTRGLLAQRCVKEFYGKHFVVSNGDIFVHDGQNAESVADGRVRRKIFDEIDSTNYKKSFVTTNWINNEMWFCYPSQGEVYANKAAIWNWVSNTWGFRDLPSTAHIAYGILPTTELRTIDSLTGTIDSWTASIDDRRYNPADRSLVMILPSTTGLFPSETLYPADDLYPSDGSSTLNTMEEGWTWNGAEYSSYIERRGLKPAKDDGVYMMRAIYPRGDGGPMTIQIGHHDSPNASVTWEDTVTYTPGGTSDKVDCRVTGRYFALRISFDSDGPGTLNGLDFDIIKVGTR